MLGTVGFARRPLAADAPVELRFVDMLMIVIATLMLVAVVLSVTSAFTASGRADVAPVITTATVPMAIAGESYSLRLAAEGGDGTFSWRVASGELPDGLGLTEEGTVQGTPARIQTSQATVEVTDGQSRSDARQLVFDVRSAGDRPTTEIADPRVVSEVLLLPAGHVGAPYRYGFAGEAGAPPYRWAVGPGALPAGLELSDDGVVAGRPGRAGTHDFMVLVTDTNGNSATERAHLVVVEPPPPLWRRVLTWLVAALTVLGALTVFQIVFVYFLGAPPTNRIPSRRERHRLRRTLR